VGRQAGAVQAELEGQEPEELLGVRERQQRLVVVRVAGRERADGRRVRLQALRRAGEARICERARRGWWGSDRDPLGSHARDAVRE
jgi:hypothetical protein